MPSSFQYVGGYTCIVSGVLLVLGHILNLGGSVEFGTVAGSTLVFSAHLLLVFALTGLYVFHGVKNGVFGFLGLVTGVIGTIASTAVVYVEIAGASGTSVSSVYASGVPSIIHSVLPLFFVIGIILFSIVIIRAKVVPVGSGYLLILGTLVFVVASFVGSSQSIVEALGAFLTGIGFIWAGFPLIVRRERC